jgi:hypothetical protein
LGGCSGHTTPATNVKDYTATLHATARCDAGETCKWYFEYWPAGSPRLGGRDQQASFKTPVQGPVNGPTGDKNLSAVISVQPGTTYRWVFCGSPNNGASFACSGPQGKPGSTTADPPPDYATFTSPPMKTLAEGWNGSGWIVQRTPRLSATAASRFTAVSCTSSTACTAVGDQGDLTGETLAERWDGTSWTVQPGAAVSGSLVELNGVSCPSPVACVAVGEAPGGTAPLAEHWNGTSWTTKPTVNPKPTDADSFFNGVSCTSASACTAVGISINHANANPPNQISTLAERWNGTAWTLQSTPSPGGAGNFLGVSCTSATSCFAVGFSGTGTLAAHWNGSTWTAQSTPSPGQSGSLSGVSCTSDTACTAVGGYQDGTRLVTLAERWNGSTWTVQPTPTPSPLSTDLKSVSCSSATSCTAVGQKLAEHWDGNSWTVQPVPSVNPLNTLASVSCPSTTSCTAVGEH